MPPRISRSPNSFAQSDGCARAQATSPSPPTSGRICARSRSGARPGAGPSSATASAAAQQRRRPRQRAGRVRPASFIATWADSSCSGGRLTRGATSAPTIRTRRAARRSEPPPRPRHPGTGQQGRPKLPHAASTSRAPRINVTNRQAVAPTGEPQEGPGRGLARVPAARVDRGQDEHAPGDQADGDPESQDQQPATGHGRRSGRCHRMLAHGPHCDRRRQGLVAASRPAVLASRHRRRRPATRPVSTTCDRRAPALTCGYVRCRRKTRHLAEPVAHLTRPAYGYHYI